jgi:nitrite reductase (NADH) large subunit
MEAAAALTKFGIKVSVVEALPWLLPRQMDMASAEILKKQLEEKMGFTFYLNSQTREIVGNGQTQGVLLASGEKLLADLVLISAGVRPNTGLAQKIGLKVNRGIVVDDHLETSIKDIFAAGDVAEHRGVVYGLWSVAQKQGEIVGANMTGHNETYTGSPPANTLMVLGINLVSAGEIDSEGKYSSITKKDNIHNTYRKLVLKDDVIIGCILLNDIRGSQEILQSIEKKRDVKPFKDMLLDDNFDFRRLT